MRVRYRYFRAGALTTWDELFSQVAEFATSIGKDRLIGISQSEDKSDALVTVWYWSGAAGSKSPRAALRRKSKT
ncbi:MAG: hypothetical protein HY291_10625 [Planctomycetes bacterium]|nr:hypothetical protein [Planctomycetota bacterium]